MTRDAPKRRVIAAVAGPLGWMAAFSCLANVIYLAAPLYMMQVYDRVLHSRSVATLMFLTLAVALCYITYAVLDAVRGTVLVGVGDIVEDRLGREALECLTTPLSGSAPSAGHIARDLDTVRQFAAGAGPLAFVDLPWVPIYLGAIALLHPVLAWFAMGASVLLLALTLATERLTRRPMNHGGQVAARSYQFGEVIARYGDCVRTMGLGPALTERWRRYRRDMTEAQNQASHRSVVFGSIGKAIRLFLQSAILGLGAWLAIENEMSAGGIFAGSLLLGRMLAPIEAILNAWRPTLSARARSRGQPSNCRSHWVRWRWKAPPGRRRVPSATWCATSS